jgi:PqqD family protein of HPr-rel-A system
MSTMRHARADGLEINVVEDGYVIYQAANDRVHYLNPTSALIFELCDGSRDVEAIASAVAEEFALADPPYAEVEQGVQQLLDEGVLR